MIHWSDRVDCCDRCIGRRNNTATRCFLINNTFSYMSGLFTPNMYCWFRKILVTIHCTTFTVTEDDISKKLIQLKIDQSPGPDLIHPGVLYETRDVIIRPPFLIFRKSLKFGTLSTDWKLAEVTAVHKKGSKSDSGNYRPISLTSVCCRIMESLVRDYVMKHLLDNQHLIQLTG